MCVAAGKCMPNLTLTLQNSTFSMLGNNCMEVVKDKSENLL